MGGSVCGNALTSVQLYCIYYQISNVHIVAYIIDMQGLVGYFDIGFDGVQHPLHMSTGPQDFATHWKQTIFFFKQPLSVHTGKTC